MNMCLPYLGYKPVVYLYSQKEEIQAIATGVFGTIDKHSSEFLPNSFAYVETEKLRNASVG